MPDQQQEVDVALTPIWYPDGLRGRVPRDMLGTLEQAVISAWFNEENAPRLQGTWCISIHSKKLLREIANAKTAVGVTYVEWKHLSCRGGVPQVIATGNHIWLTVYYPWSTPSLVISFPRHKSAMFGTLKRYSSARDIFRNWTNTVPLNSLPMLPPRICAACGEKARKRCGACRLVYYCNDECQSLDRDNHRAGCDKVKLLTPTLSS